MAYSKKTWKARQGLGLNKFSIDGATPVPVVNQPDSVTQQGDALSAGNLNDLEDRIANAFDDVEESKVDKSETDDLQNQIINLNSDVATLDAIVGSEAEIENTDPSEGQSVLSSSRLIHHVNLLPSGEFGLVGARDVKWNQLLQNKSTATNNGVTFTSNGNGVYTVNRTESSSSSATFVLMQSTPLTNGHYYLIAGCPSGGGSSKYRIRDYSNGIWDEGNGVILHYTGTYPDLRIFVDNSYSPSNLVFKPILRDLTEIFGSGNEPTSVANVPAWMLSYTPYDAGSIVNLNPTGFSIRGINLWDEETELGIYNITTGQPSSSSINLRFKNRAEVSPSTSYYFFRPSLTIVALWYDADDNYISFTSVTSGTNTATSPSNAVYLRCYLASEYGTTYNHDIQIADNSLPSSVKTVYHAYNGQTVPVSISGHYVNENCYDYVTNKTVNGVLRGEVHTKVGTIALGSMNWVQDGSYMLSNSLSGIAKFPSSNANLGNMLCDVFMPVAFTGLNDNTKISMMQSGYVAVYGSTAPTSGNLYYELATEVVTYTEPLRSFSVSDYCTIEPITPQTIPNRIDVPFSVLSKSNNGLIEQITQNTADIADNKQILAQHEARIANLEQVSGDYITEDMQDYSSVPTGKATYALVETMKGVSRVENQLCIRTLATLKTLNTSGTWSDNAYSLGGLTFTVNDDGSVTVTGSNSGTHNFVVAVNPFSVAHKALLNGCPSGGSTSTYRLQWTNNIDTQYQETGGGLIVDAFTNTGNLVQIRITDASNINQTFRPNLTDLTLYFNGNIPSNADTVAHIAQYYPQLLEPRAYNAGEIIDSTYTSVTSRGVNIWDEQTELGNIYNPDGSPTSDSYQIRASNYTKVSPNATLYFYCGSGDVLGLFAYDAGKNFIGVYVSGSFVVGSPSYTDIGHHSITLPANCHYIRIKFGSSYGTTYKHDTQIVDDSLSSAIKTTYHPYMTDTLTIPSVTLRSAGSVSDTLDVESGEITRRIGSYTFDGTETVYGGSDGNFNTPDLASLIKFSSSATVKSNLLMAGYVNRSYSDVNDKIYPMTVGAYNGTVTFYNPSITSNAGAKAELTGKTLYFEKATPTTESVSPTLDNTLKTEGGGTVYSDADVDGQFTLGFLNL